MNDTDAVLNEKIVDITSVIIVDLIIEAHGIVTVIPVIKVILDHIINGKDIITNIVTIIEMKDTTVAMIIS